MGTRLAPLLLALLQFFPALLQLFEKARAQDTGWEGEHADAQDGGKRGDYPAPQSNWNNIALADGRKGDDAPSHSFRHAGELIRLSAVLREEHDRRCRNQR